MQAAYNKMKEIYRDGDYVISANIQTGRVKVSGGTSSFETWLRPLKVDMPKFQLDILEKNNVSPMDYRCVERAGVIVRKGCEEKWMEALKKHEEYEKSEHQKFLKKFEGIEVLRAAFDAEEVYCEDFQAAMDDEQRDGARMPSQPKISAEALSVKYPLAALYLRCESYERASNDQKSTAGMNAKEVLTEKGKDGMAEAETILANWLPESAGWR